MQDRHGHRISYLRVSITDRCNERCTYCMPQELQEWLPRSEILTYEETLRLIRIGVELGVSKVRITGGEPLTRRGVLDLVRELPKIPGLRDIGLSTNGTLLAREVEPQRTMATALRNASVRSVNISLDTLDRQVYSGARVSNEWPGLLLSDPWPPPAGWLYRRDDKPTFLRELQQTSSHVRWKITSVSRQLSRV